MLDWQLLYHADTNNWLLLNAHNHKRYLTPTPESALDIAHTVTSNHHIVTDNWHWQSSTDTNGRQLILTVINWHWQSSTDTDSRQLILTIINWHLHSSTDVDSHQLTLTVETDTDSCQLTQTTDSAWLHPVIYWPGPDFTGRYGRPSFRAWISSALNTSNSSDSLLVGWNWLYTGNGATNLEIWINRYNSI